jgi:hypothetical protein
MVMYGFKIYLQGVVMQVGLQNKIEQNEHWCSRTPSEGNRYNSGW